MLPDSRAREYEFLARLLRADDREVVIHRLLGSCIHGPEGFGSLLPHVPANPVQLWSSIAVSDADIKAAADALEHAALAIRDARDGCPGACACRPILAEGIDVYLTRAVTTVPAKLRAAKEPYYRHLGEILDRKILAGHEDTDHTTEC